MTAFRTLASRIDSLALAEVWVAWATGPDDRAKVEAPPEVSDEAILSAIDARVARLRELDAGAELTAAERDASRRDSLKGELGRIVASWSAWAERARAFGVARVTITGGDLSPLARLVEAS